jgi:predicted N-formylglutamate amidohydrolase
LVLVCEHASAEIPPSYDLALAPEVRKSHAAWDIGALDVATGLSEALQAPLVAGTLSRLLYDLNRPIDAPDAMPEGIENYQIPGNSGLSADTKAARIRNIHDPFHKALAQTIEQTRPKALITIHSFTPVFKGVARDVELGFLRHKDDRLAQQALSVEQARKVFDARLDAPYSASDGVTYTLQRHGEANGLFALMIEIRNDLIATRKDALRMADHLETTIMTALEALSS